MAHTRAHTRAPWLFTKCACTHTRIQVAPCVKRLRPTCVVNPTHGMTWPNPSVTALLELFMCVWVRVRSWVITRERARERVCVCVCVSGFVGEGIDIGNEAFLCDCGVCHDSWLTCTMTHAYVWHDWFMHRDYFIGEGSEFAQKEICGIMVYLLLCIREHGHAHTHTRTHTHTHAHAHTHTRIEREKERMRESESHHAHTHIICTKSGKDWQLCKRDRICMHIRIYIYVHTHMYSIHTHTYVYAHICI